MFGKKIMSFVTQFLGVLYVVFGVYFITTTFMNMQQFLEYSSVNGFVSYILMGIAALCAAYVLTGAVYKYTCGGSVKKVVASVAAPKPAVKKAAPKKAKAKSKAKK